jgi:hypothetical protein
MLLPSPGHGSAFYADRTGLANIADAHKSLEATSDHRVHGNILQSDFSLAVLLLGIR